MRVQHLMLFSKGSVKNCGIINNLSWQLVGKLHLPAALNVYQTINKHSFICCDMQRYRSRRALTDFTIIFPQPPAPDDLSIVCFTSGTTGNNCTNKGRNIISVSSVLHSFYSEYFMERKFLIFGLC